MRVDLVDLLNSKEVAHPSRIISVHSSCEGDCSLKLAGYPWWFDSRPLNEESELEIRIEGITSGRLDTFLFNADPSDEDLEVIDAAHVSELPWAQGDRSEIFCAQPVPNPVQIYAVLHDFLMSSGCPFEPSDYLNMGSDGSFSNFGNIARSRSFLLCNGPYAICQEVAEELNRQNVTHNILQHEIAQSKEILVQIKDCQIICTSAVAIFE